MDVTGKYSPRQLYDKGLYTLEELIEMDPNLDPEWIEEQERLIEENHKKYADMNSWENYLARVSQKA